MPRFGRFLLANLLLLAIFPGTAVMAAWPRTTPISSPSRALIRAFASAFQIVSLGAGA